MNRIPDEEARDIMRNQIDCRLVVAKDFLDRITQSVPKEGSFEHLLLETNVDAFLFFASSVIDMIKVEINNRFDLFDRENVFYIHGIRKKLGGSGIQKQTKDVIAEYFTAPTRDIQPGAKPRHAKTDVGCFDATRSTLWELQALRNKAVHGKTLSIADHRASVEFTIRCAGAQKNPKYAVAIENPNEYFLQIFNNLTSFVRQIRLLNPQQIQSSERFDLKPE